MPLEVGIRDVGGPGGGERRKKERKGVDSTCGMAALMSWLWFTLHAG